MAVLETGNGEIQVKRIDIPHTDTPVKVPVGTDTRKAVENISRGMKKGENIKDMAKKYGCSRNLPNRSAVSLPHIPV